MAARPILTTLMLCCATLAHASPRTDPTIGRSVFTGATHEHPTSIGLNPAALGRGFLERELFVALTSTLDSYTIDLATAPAVSGTQLGAGGIVAVVLRPAGRYAFSFEARVPPPERFPQHDELRYFTLGHRQRDLMASIAATIRATNRLYFGATFTHQNTFLRLRYARDAGAARGEPDLENPDATEEYDVRVNSPYVSTSNIGFTLGMLVRLYNEIWLGVGYHTPPGFNLQSELEGNVHIIRERTGHPPIVDGPIGIGGRGELPGDAVVDVSYPASIDAEISAKLPADFLLHIGGRWEDLSRMQAYDVRVIGSQLEANSIPEWQLRTRGMHDSFALWGGIEQEDKGELEPFRFGARVGFETSAVTPDRTTPLTLAPSSLTLDVGASYRYGSWVAQLSYGLQYFRPVSVADSDFDPRFHAECAAAGYDYTTRACQGVRDGYAIANGAGDYERMLHSVRLGFRYELP